MIYLLETYDRQSFQNAIDYNVWATWKKLRFEWGLMSLGLVDLSFQPLLQH